MLNINDLNLNVSKENLLVDLNDTFVNLQSINGGINGGSWFESLAQALGNEVDSQALKVKTLSEKLSLKQ